MSGAMFRPPSVESRETRHTNRSSLAYAFLLLGNGGACRKRGVSMDLKVAPLLQAEAQPSGPNQHPAWAGRGPRAVP